MSAEEHERLLKQREESQVRQEERQVAQQLATQAAADRGAAEEGYWRVIGDPDIKRQRFETQEHLHDFVATEMSDKFALGNIKHADWESWKWQIENEFLVMRNEFADADTKLDDVDMATMYGESRPTLTNERARRLRGAMQVKKMMTSLSIGARGLRSGTEIHAVAKTEQPDQESEDGFLSGLKSRLV